MCLGRTPHVTTLCGDHPHHEEARLEAVARDVDDRRDMVRERRAMGRELPYMTGAYHKDKDVSSCTFVEIL